MPRQPFSVEAFPVHPVKPPAEPASEVDGRLVILGKAVHDRQPSTRSNTYFRYALVDQGAFLVTAIEESQYSRRALSVPYIVPAIRALILGEELISCPLDPAVVAYIAQEPRRQEVVLQGFTTQGNQCRVRYTEGQVQKNRWVDLPPRHHITTVDMRTELL